MITTQQEQSNYELLKYFPLLKVDEQTHTVYGIASCEKEDKDGEIADYEGTKKAYQEWSKEAQESTTAAGQDVSLGNIRYMHKLILAGKATKLKFDDDRKQVWVESTPAPPISKEDPDIWPLLVGGYLRGYSHAGKYASRVCNVCRKNIKGNFCQHCGKDVVVRYIPVLAELSWVDNPCLKQATFTVVKSDGSTELKKFSETPLVTALTSLEKLQQSTREILPERKSMTKLEQQLRAMIKKGKCSCACAKCKDGNCAECTGETKCSATAKAVKYLVSSGGETHLPYTGEDGKPNHRLMGAAWAALHGGYRGNKYEGPDKAGAIKRLKQLYAAEGLDTPAEKAAAIDEFLKTGLVDAINGRAFGQSLTKGMYNISRMADLTESIKYLWLSLEYERAQENDESPVTDDIHEAYMVFLDHLLAYVEEQCEEAKSQDFTGSY